MIKVILYSLHYTKTPQTIFYQSVEFFYLKKSSSAYMFLYFYKLFDSLLIFILKSKIAAA